jgi:ankyrin repeat protein
LDVIATLLDGGADRTVRSLRGDSLFEFMFDPRAAALVASTPDEIARARRAEASTVRPKIQLMSGSTLLCEVRLEKPLSLDAPGSRNRLVNSWAAAGDVEKLAALESDPRVLKSRYLGETLLQTAAKFGEVGAMAKLLELGLDVEAKDHNGLRPMEQADRDMRREVMRCLGRDLGRIVPVHAYVRGIESRDGPAFHDETPLYRAAEWGAGPVRLLLEFGADIERCGASGTSPVVAAIWTGAADSVLLLHRAGGRLDADPDGVPPLMQAVVSRDVATVRAVLATGDEDSIVDIKGTDMNALAIAVGRGLWRSPSCWRGLT